jgi:hypothetical protein
LILERKVEIFDSIFKTLRQLDYWLEKLFGGNYMQENENDSQTVGLSIIEEDEYREEIEEKQSEEIVTKAPNPAIKVLDLS